MNAPAGQAGPGALPGGFRRVENPRDLCCGSRAAFYAEAAPPAGLGSLVAFFWWLRSEGTPHRITPDGAMDLVIEPGARGGARVVGVRQRALRTRAFRPMEIFGVRFRAGAGARLLGVRADALTDGAAELGAVLDGPGAAWEQRLGEAATPEAMVAALTALVRERAARAGAGLAAPPSSSSGRWAAAERLLRRSAGTLPVRALSAELGVGERQLERIFRERVGVTPKVYARLLRFEASLSLARRGARWAEVAAALGFADQSHLVREYHALAGTSPSLLAREWRLSGFSIPDLPMPGSSRSGRSRSGFSKTSPARLPTLSSASKEDER